MYGESGHAPSFDWASVPLNAIVTVAMTNDDD